MISNPQLKFLRTAECCCVKKFMRLVQGLLLVIAILAAVLWFTAAVASGIAKVIAILFLALFILSLFLKGRRPEKM